MKSTFFVLAVLSLLSCNHTTSNRDTSQGTFAIYTLQDSTTIVASAMGSPIEGLALSDSAFLIVADLKSYIWVTHTFELAPQAQPKFERLQSLHGKSSGMPFVVTVGNERIYLGTFWWAYSSSMPPACAVIEVLGPVLSHQIQLANNAIDKRSDPRIYSSLKQAGVLVE